jgi:hypothetical protein
MTVPPVIALLRVSLLVEGTDDDRQYRRDSDRLRLRDRVHPEEYAQIDRLTQECLDAGTVCFHVPSAFTRFAIYAFIGLTEVIALFSLSIVVEDRARRRHYAPEWR